MSRKSKSRKLEAAAKSQHPGGFRRERPEPVQAAVKTRPRGLGSMAPRWIHWRTPSLVALFTLAVFLPTLQNQFVTWDDDKNFLDNPHYRGLGWTHLRWMWTTFHMGHYLPLTWMTLGMDYLLWGMNPFGYHLTNLLLHATNAVVFFFLARRILTLALSNSSERGRALPVGAAFAALVFAIHPLRVESVAWVTERRDVLSGLFYLVTVLAYLLACQREGRGRWWYWLSVAVFGCALLSKSMAVSLPLVLLILDVYPLRRLGGSLGWWSQPARRVYVEKIPFVLLAAVVSAIAFKALFSLDNVRSLAQLSVMGRLAVSAYGLSFYLWKMVLPLNLSPLYVLPPTVNSVATPSVLSYGVVLAITATALALRRRVPGVPAAWLAYVAVLLPVIGIFQNGPQIAADRYTYLASLGWATLAGAGLASCWPTSRRLEAGTTFSRAGLAIGVVVGFGILTWNQVQIWHDSERLWTYALAIDPDSPIAHNNLGEQLNRQGRPAEAIEHFQRALRTTPDYALAHNNWGMALNRQGRPAEAIDHFQQALRTTPDYALAHNNWGTALLQLGKPAEAIEHFHEALVIKRDLADAHTNWGLVLTQQGKLAEAAEHSRQALILKGQKVE